MSNGQPGTLNVPTVDQYTSTVQPGTSPTLVASFSGNYQVINPDLTATVWLGETQSVGVGRGIPLYPGTGMVWTASQGTHKLYAVNDQPTASDVIIGNMVRDWQPNPIAVATAVLNSGVIIIDQPVILFGPALNSVAAQGFAVGSLIDVRRFNSVYIRNLYVAGTGSISLVWYSDPVNQIQVGADSYSWANGDNLTSSEQIPVCGAYLSVQWNWSQINGFNLTIQGSNRPVPIMRQRMSDRNVLQRALTSVAGNGGTLTTNPSYRYDGPAILQCFADAGGANEPYFVQINNIVSGISQKIYFFSGPAGATNTVASLITPIVIPRSTWSVTMNNQTAAPKNMACWVTTCPEGA